MYSYTLAELRAAGYDTVGKEVLIGEGSGRYSLPVQDGVVVSQVELIRPVSVPLPEPVRDEPEPVISRPRRGRPLAPRKV